MRRDARTAAIAATLTFASIAGTFGQFALGSLSPYLTVEFSLTRTELGLATTTVFVIAALVSAPVGRAVDHFGGRLLTAALFVAAASSWWVMATAQAYVVLLAGAALAGVSLAAANPATNRVVASEVENGAQAKVMGIKQAGAPFAGVLAGGLLPIGAEALGWRGTLYVASAVGILGAVAALRWVPRHLVTPEVRAREERMADATVIRWLSRYAFFMGVGMSATFAYATLYAYEDIGLTRAEAGLTLAVIGTLGAALTVVGGLWARRARQMSKALARLALGAAGFTVITAAAAELHPSFLWIGLAGFGVTAIPWHVLGMTAIVRNLSSARAGRGSGTVLLAFFLGVVVSPFIFGVLVDATDSYAVGWGWVAASFLGASAVAYTWARQAPLRG